MPFLSINSVQYKQFYIPVLFFFERMNGIEPSSLDWKSNALTVVLHSHRCLTMQSYKTFLNLANNSLPAGNRTLI